MALTRRSVDPMTLVWGLIFLIVGLAIGAVAAWITTRAEVRVAREELAAERAERRTEATAGIGRIADDLSTHLEIVKKQIGDLEKQRAAGDASLKTTLEGLHSSDQELRTALVAATGETARLTTALRDNRVRGRWGELSLRRIVELSGMVEHCDFSEQKTVDGKRPDAIVHLPDNMTIPIDAKAPLEDYYKALESSDPAETKRLLEANAGALRAKVREVARRDYAASSDARFTIVFIPLESVLSAALSVDPSILEDALREGVHIASPMTLIATLRAFAYGWSLHKQQRNAEDILSHSRKLVERLGTFGRTFAQVGNALEMTVKRWNEAVGSFDGRLSVTAREIAQLSGETIDQTEPKPVESAVRPVMKIETLELFSDAVEA
jgi:DNA recombination protein RmuC